MQAIIRAVEDATLAVDSVIRNELEISKYVMTAVFCGALKLASQMILCTLFIDK